MRIVIVPMLPSKANKDILILVSSLIQNPVT